MSAPAQYIEHGSLATPVLIAARIRTSTHDLDEGDLVYHASARGAFTEGANSADFPGLYIHNITERALPASRWEVTLDVSGLETGTSKRTGLTWQEDPFGWDIATEERIALTTATFNFGAALSGFSNMRLMQKATEDMLDDHWSRRGLVYRGIRTTGLIERKITVNENIVQPDTPAIVNLPGGWEEARRSNIAFSRVVLTERLKSLSPPPTQVIPGPVIGLPASGLPWPDVQTFTIDGDLISNWPNGWKYANIESEELYAGAALWIITYTYEYVWPQQF